MLTPRFSRRVCLAFLCAALCLLQMVVEGVEVRKPEAKQDSKALKFLSQIDKIDEEASAGVRAEEEKLA